MKSILLLFYALLFIACSEQEKPEFSKAKSPDTEIQIIEMEIVTEVTADFGYSIFQNADGSYGYEIHNNGAKVIRQQHIPAVPGNSGFENKEEAKAMAELVIRKLANQIMPPTVSVEEVDSIRALY